MNLAYESFHKQAEINKQAYTIFRFASKCNTVAALIKDDRSIVTFLAAQNKKIDICPYESNISIEKFDSISKEVGSKLTLYKDYSSFQISNIDLLYIDTFADGNLKAMELTKFGVDINKYIIITNTVKYAHSPEQGMNWPKDKQLGVIFGINHFITNNVEWFILEHDDLDPGITVLVNRKNVNDAY